MLINVSILEQKTYLSYSGHWQRNTFLVIMQVAFIQPHCPSCITNFVILHTTEFFDMHKQ